MSLLLLGLSLSVVSISVSATLSVSMSLYLLGLSVPNCLCPYVCVCVYTCPVTPPLKSVSPAVECGRAFPGSTNWNAKNSVYFSKPLLARYVRIYADTYNNWPSWRAGLLLCEKDCKGKHLDYQLLGDYGSATNGPMITSAWGSGAYTTGTGFYFDNGEGLKLDEVNCINDKATYTILLYARLRYVTGSRQVIGSKSWGTDGGVAVAYGANYQLIPSTADVECPWKIYDDKYYHFGMTRDDKGTVSLYLNGFKCASGFFPPEI